MVTTWSRSRLVQSPPIIQRFDGVSARDLQLGEVELFGTLPEWSTPATFQHLESLIIGGCNITGARTSA